GPSLSLPLLPPGSTSRRPPKDRHPRPGGSVLHRRGWVSFTSAVTLRTATLAIRPVMDFHDPNESKEDRQKRRLLKAREALVSVQEQVERNKPFYAPDVYDKARAVIKVCHKEAVYSDYTERPHHEYWDEA